MRRNGLVLVLSAALLVGAVGAAVLLGSDEEERERFAVQWETIELSPDRRTVTVVASHPTEGFCAKEPDGVELEIEGSVAKVTVWMAGPTPRDGLFCNLGCGQVTQAVTLDERLPESVERFEPVADAVEGCWP